MKILYLPIHIPGTYHERSIANKRGLHAALAKRGYVRELDYLAVPRETLYDTVRAEIESVQPDLLFLQLQGTDCLTPDHLREFRRQFPNMALVNWNGDYWPEHLTSPDMLELLRQVDLQLVVNGSVLEDYEREGIHAAFCPFGYEPPVRELPEMPAYDVLFLGNNYSEKRQQLYDVLRSLPYNVGIWGVGWPQAEGECNYDFATAEALYRRAKICVSDNQFPDARGYMSDRPIQIMGAGGFLLQQYVKDIGALVGFKMGRHGIMLPDFKAFVKWIPFWLDAEHESARQGIADAAQRFVMEHHTWDNRVRMVIDELLPKVREHANPSI